MLLSGPEISGPHDDIGEMLRSWPGPETVGCVLGLTVSLFHGPLLHMRTCHDEQPMTTDANYVIRNELILRKNKSQKKSYVLGFFGKFDLCKRSLT